jgi:hypothetical protein
VSQFPQGVGRSGAYLWHFVSQEIEQCLHALCATQGTEQGCSQSPEARRGMGTEGESRGEEARFRQPYSDGEGGFEVVLGEGRQGPGQWLCDLSASP